MFPFWFKCACQIKPKKFLISLTLCLSKTPLCPRCAEHEPLLALLKLLNPQTLRETTGHRPPATGHTPLTTTTGHRPDDHRPTPTGHRPTATGHRPPARRRRPHNRPPTTATGRRPPATATGHTDKSTIAVVGQTSPRRHTDREKPWWCVTWSGLYGQLQNYKAERISPWSL